MAAEERSRRRPDEAKERGRERERGDKKRGIRQISPEEKRERERERAEEPTPTQRCTVSTVATIRKSEGERERERGVSEGSCAAKETKTAHYRMTRAYDAQGRERSRRQAPEQRQQSVVERWRGREHSESNKKEERKKREREGIVMRSPFIPLSVAAEQRCTNGRRDDVQMAEQGRERERVRERKRKRARETNLFSLSFFSFPSSSLSSCLLPLFFRAPQLRNGTTYTTHPMRRPTAPACCIPVSQPHSFTLLSSLFPSSSSLPLLKP